MQTPQPRPPRALNPRSWTERVRHELTLPIPAQGTTGSFIQQPLCLRGAVQPWVMHDWAFGAALQSLDAPRFVPVGSVRESITSYAGTVYHDLTHTQARP